MRGGMNEVWDLGGVEMLWSGKYMNNIALWIWIILPCAPIGIRTKLRMCVSIAGIARSNVI